MFQKVILLIILLTSFLSAERKQVSLQLSWLDQFEFAGFYMAKEKDFYKNVGLQVNLKKFSSSIDLTETVLSGKADFGTASSSLLVDKANGKDIVLLGSVFQSSPLILLALKDSSIKTIKDIKNKKIMISSDQLRLAAFQTMLVSQGIKEDDLHLIEHTFNIDDLINRKTDLMVAYTTNEPFLLKEKGIEPLIFYPKDYGLDFYEELIFTSSSFATKNPDVVDSFYKASIKGWEYAFNHIEETVQLIHKKYNPQKKSLASLKNEANAMKKLVFDKKGNIGTINTDRLKLIETSYRIMGMIQNKIDIESLIFKKPNKNNLTQFERYYLKDKRVINMCIDPNWMPFEKNEKGKHIGMTAEYFKLLENKLDIPIKMVPTNTWTHSLQKGKKRECDIFSLIMPTPQRLKYLDFTKAYLEIPLVVATTNDALFINNITQIKKEKLGIVKNYAYGEILREKYKNIDFIDVLNIQEGLDKVERGELFGFIGTLATVAYHIQSDYIGQIKIGGKFDEKWDLGIGTRNDEPLLNSIFNKAIDQITTQEHQRILNKWVSINYQVGLTYSTIWRYILATFAIVFLLVLSYRQYLLRDLNKKLEIKVKEEIKKNIQQNELLSQQAKMVAMGEMIGNIAHQWRQPLSMISTASTGMKIQKEIGTLDDKDFYTSVDAINNASQYLSKTIDDFRNFFKQNKEKNRVTIEHILEKALKIVSAQFVSKDIEIIQNQSNIEILTFENELIQVFINILNNSRDALLDIKHKRLIFIDSYKEGENLIITIKDNANGIPKKIINKVFEPYFTTKHKAQGTGIGLYMTEEIIVKHLKGSIYVSNEHFNYKGIEYKGAKFKIILPLS